MEWMFAGSFTKALKGQRFQYFCTKIMNLCDGVPKDNMDWDVQVTKTYMVTSRASPQECVVGGGTFQTKKSDQNITNWPQND